MIVKHNSINPLASHLAVMQWAIAKIYISQNNYMRYYFCTNDVYDVWHTLCTKSHGHMRYSQHRLVWVGSCTSLVWDYASCHWQQNQQWCDMNNIWEAYMAEVHVFMICKVIVYSNKHQLYSKDFFSRKQRTSNRYWPDIDPTRKCRIYV